MSCRLVIQLVFTLLLCQYVAPFSLPSATTLSHRTATARRHASSHLLRQSSSSANNPSSSNETEEEQQEKTTNPIVTNSNAFAQSYLSSLQHTEPVGHDHITGLDQVVVGFSCAALVVTFAEMFLSAGWRFYLAGGICAAVSHTIATPIDVVKTRKQVDPDLVNLSFTKATSSIIEKEGIQTLLSGLGPTTIGYFLEGSVKFGIYEIMKPRVQQFTIRMAHLTSLAFLQSQLLSFVICGAISGVAASLVLCPMEAIRIRLVAEPEIGRGGWIKAAYKMLKREGFEALTKGNTAMMCKQVPYTISKNVFFDVLTKASYGLILASGMAVKASTKIYVPFTCALLTSVVATICSQPGDMLLSLVNAHEGKRRTRQFIQDIVKGDWGLKGFFVGTKSRFLHVGLIVTMQLILYDFVKRCVGIAATGL